MSAEPATSGDSKRRHPALALALAPIPGVGHWVVGRGGRGLLAFAALAAGINIVLLSSLVAPVARLSPALGWLLAGASVLFSLVDVTRIVLRGRSTESAS